MSDQPDNPETALEEAAEQPETGSATVAESPSETSEERDLHRLRLRALHLGFDLSPFRSLKRFEEGEDASAESTAVVSGTTEESALMVLRLLSQYNAEKPWIEPQQADDAPLHLEATTTLEEVMSQLSQRRKVDSLEELAEVIHEKLGEEEEDDSADAEITSTESASQDLRHQPNEKAREEIGQRLRMHLSPAVREYVESRSQKEQERFAEVEPLLTKVAQLEQVESHAFEAIHTLSLQSQRRHKEITASAAEQIEHWNRIRGDAEMELDHIHEHASGLERGWLTTQKLLTYRRQMETQRFMNTPSRVKILDELLTRFEAKPWQLLVGSNGTGKTELAKQALTRVCNGYHLLPGVDSLSPANIFGRRILQKSNGNTVSGIKPGPATRALTAEPDQPAGLLFDESNVVPLRVAYLFKGPFNNRRGEDMLIPEIDEPTTMPEHFGSIWTANPKDERTPNREEWDAGINRILRGIKVPFMPEEEQRAMIFQRLIDKSGVLRLSPSEARLIRSLISAAVMTQRCFDREFDLLKDDERQALESAIGTGELSLTKKCLDPGRLYEIFDTFEQRRAEGDDVRGYLFRELEKLLDECDVKEERDLTHAILKLKGVLAESSASGGIAMEGPTAAPANERQYLLPSELGFLLGDEEGFKDNDPFTAAGGSDGGGGGDPGDGGDGGGDGGNENTDDILDAVLGSKEAQDLLAAVRGEDATNTTNESSDPMTGVFSSSDADELVAIINGEDPATNDASTNVPTSINVITTPDSSYAKARKRYEEVLGPGFVYGPEEVLNMIPTLGISDDKLPSLPKREVLDWHIAQKHIMVLRTSRYPASGSSVASDVYMTLPNLQLGIGDNAKKTMGVERRALTMRLGEKEPDFFTAARPKFEWAFLGRFPNDTSRTYGQQLLDLRKQIAGEAVEPNGWSTSLLQAAGEFDSIINPTTGDVPDDISTSVPILDIANSQLNTLLRPSAPEAAYDLCLMKANGVPGDVELDVEAGVWTNTLYNEGANCVTVGPFGTDGLSVESTVLTSNKTGVGGYYNIRQANTNMKSRYRDE